MSSVARQLVGRFYDEVLNQKRLDVLAEIISDDFLEHGDPPIERGVKGFRSFVEGIIRGFPDVRLTVDDWIVEGDRVVARVSVEGTHRGEVFGFAPTGKHVSWTAIHIWRAADGRLVERWSEANVLGIFEQLQPAT
jgi:predicted ester cyclase